MRFSQFIGPVIMAMAVSCASNSKSQKQLAQSQGIIFGKLEFIVEGENWNHACSMVVADSKGEEFTVKANQTGELEASLPMGSFSVEKISCKKNFASLTYTHNFNPQELIFFNSGEGKRTYIGDVKFHWETKGPHPIWYVLSIPMTYLLMGGSTEQLFVEGKDLQHNYPNPGAAKSLITIPPLMQYSEKGMLAESSTPKSK